MMKRIFLYLMVLIYVIPTVGMSMTMHYCGGELSSIELGFTNTKSCGCSVKSEKKGCCDDKTVTIKSDTKHQKTNEAKVPKIKFEWSSPVLCASFDYQALLVEESVNTKSIYYPPPLYKSQLFILYNVFRI